uniref:Uncharacterized protein n=1 Tax=Trichuris muris TaxID=70415 RepID=A0A5S6QJK1_TRIMR
MGPNEKVFPQSRFLSIFNRGQIVQVN